MTATIIAQDFANIFKAFIGTNYLTVSFAFKESGLLLGLIGIGFIFIATSHCCHLIVKCKKDVIRRILTDPQSLKGSVSSKLLRSPKGELEQIITYGEIAGATLGRFGLVLTVFGLFITQFGFCLGYFVFIADTIQQSLDSFFVNNTNSSDDSFEVYATPEPESEDHVIDYRLLLLIPLPFFLVFSMLRRIRQMGIISGVANILVAIGFVSITVIILTDFELADDISWYCNFKGFPVFFGQVTAAYEGIGTIIPIESSMEGNRGLYPILLYAAILLFTGMYCFMGILGYLRYGNEVAQGLVWSLPRDNVFALLINIVICIAVLLTYPLQNFVTIQIVEGIIWGKAIYAVDEVTDGTTDVPTEDRQSLITSGTVEDSPEQMNGSVQHNKGGPMDQSDGEVATKQPRIYFWKRAIVRASIVFVQFGLAMALKNDYAYVSALVGALGCILLQYILPCLIHLRLEGWSSPPLVILKDSFLVVFGVLAMGSGLYYSILNIIDNM